MLEYSYRVERFQLDISRDTFLDLFLFMSKDTLFSSHSLTFFLKGSRQFPLEFLIIFFIPLLHRRSCCISKQVCFALLLVAELII